MKVFFLIVCALQLPALYADVAKRSTISVVTLEINGVENSFRTNELPELIRGDTLRIKKVEIGRLSADRIDVQGFDIPLVEGQLPHDENIEIETKNRINARQIQNGSIPVISFRDEAVFSQFNIPIKSPSWNYSELKINHQSAVARPGDSLKMRLNDQVQLVRIETNLEQNDRINVKFEPKTKQKGVLTSRLVFYYRDYAFGSVRIQLTNE